MTAAAKSDRVVVACASDAEYVRPLAAMLRSLVDNLGTGRALDVYILHSGIGESERRAIAHGWPERCTAHWLTADENAFGGLPLWGRMPVSTYFKLALPDMLPRSVRRAIWLDCDLLVLDDIGLLWDREMGNRPLGAVQDAVVPLVSSRCGVAGYAELGIDAREKYFNAGVMVIDVEAWRRDKVQARAVDYLKRYQRAVVFWDQEGLNAALAGRWASLDEAWNHNASVPRRKADVGRPAIIHFAGGLKPWRFRTDDPERGIYYDYLDRTSFRGWRPSPSITGALVNVYEAVGLRRTFYPLENVGMRMIRGLSRRLSPRR